MHGGGWRSGPAVQRRLMGSHGNHWRTPAFASGHSSRLTRRWPRCRHRRERRLVASLHRPLVNLRQVLRSPSRARRPACALSGDADGRPEHNAQDALGTRGIQSVRKPSSSSSDLGTLFRATRSRIHPSQIHSGRTWWGGPRPPGDGAKDHALASGLLDFLVADQDRAPPTRRRDGHDGKHAGGEASRVG